MGFYQVLVAGCTKHARHYKVGRRSNSAGGAERFLRSSTAAIFYRLIYYYRRQHCHRRHSKRHRILYFLNICRTTPTQAEEVVFY